MRSAELADKIKYFRERLGDSLLVAKCYEIMGGKDVEASGVARQVARAELSALARMSSQNVRTSALAEQFLRVIYAFQLSGALPEAIEMFSRFIKAAALELSRSGELDVATRFRLCTSLIILDDHNTSLINLLGHQDDFLTRFSEAWRTSDLEELEACADELEEQIELAENEEDMVPWSDVWHYVLAGRLVKFIEQKTP